jgi:hypothetical protein
VIPIEHWRRQRGLVQEIRNGPPTRRVPRQ